MSNKEFSDMEQREARVFEALDDWDRAQENHQVAVQSYNRHRSYFWIALVSFAISIGLGIWVITR